MTSPRRKYTVTPKVLAANRAKLIKANAVDPAIRYRSTPSRLAACRANLLKAHAANLPSRPEIPLGLQSCSPRQARSHVSALVSALNRDRVYGGCFRHGLYAPDLARSLRLAGESAPEYFAHLRRFDRAMEPRDEDEKNLVRGIAEATWRRLRVFRGHANWEKHALLHLLNEAARARAAFGAAESVVGASGARPAAECPSALHDAAEDDSPFPPPPEFAAALGREMLRLFRADTAMEAFVVPLNQRIERLCRLWLEERASRGHADERGEDDDDEDDILDDHIQFEYITRPRASEIRLLGRSAASMGNPFRTGAQMARAFEPRPHEPLLDSSPWDWKFDAGSPYKPPPFWAGEWPAEGVAVCGAVLHRAFSPRTLGPGGARPVDATGARPGAECPSALGDAAECPSALNDFPAFLALFERAFGVGPGGAPGREPAGANHTGEPAAALRDKVRALARLVWKRLDRYERQAERESDRLREALEAAIRERRKEPKSSGKGAGFAARFTANGADDDEAEDPEGDLTALGDAEDPDARLAMRIVTLLDHYQKAFERAFKLEDKIKRALDGWLGKRAGPPHATEGATLRKKSKLGNDELGIMKSEL